MSYSIYDNYIAQAPDGTLVAGASVTVYLAGTLTLASLFSDEGTTAIDNPVTSGVNGRVTFYAESGKYDLSVLYDDETTGYADVLIGGDSDNIKYESTDLYSRMISLLKREAVHVDDYGAIADADPNDRTAGTDSTSAFKAAITAARSSNRAIAFSGNYRIEDTLFFGPLDQASIDTFPPNNICAGIACSGTSENNSIVCGLGLDGKVVLDYTGIGNAKVAKSFTIYAKESTSAPSVGILTARFLHDESTNVTGNYGGIFEDVVMFKYFSIAPRLAFTTEETREIRLNIRTDHPDSYGCFVSVADPSSVSYEAGTYSEGGAYVAGPTWNDLVGPPTESSLNREDRAGSNLHQTNIKCDYYYGNNAPDERKNPAMLQIRGANGFSCRDAFFNNNLTSIDCIQIRKSGALGIPFGIEVLNPLYHQNTKCGIRIMTGLAKLDVKSSNDLPGFNFDESEVVVDGYLNKSSLYGIDSLIVNADGYLVDSCVDRVIGSASIYGSSKNSKFSSCNDFRLEDEVGAVIDNCEIQCTTLNYSTTRSIVNSIIQCDDTVNMTGNRSGAADLTLYHNGTVYQINGQIKSEWIGTPAVLPTSALQIQSSNSSDLERKILRGGANYNFSVYERDGFDVINTQRDGNMVFNDSSGGIVLTSDSDGAKWRLKVSSGILSIVPYTQPT